jgi:protocatechuate 3,4-dioxygenase beta subunit
MKTNVRGEYRFSTIRPASYPGSRIPAHIHAIVKEPGRNEYYIDDYLFEDDPFLTDGERARLQNTGGPGILRLTREPTGLWKGKRNIFLGRNVAHY